MPKPPQNTAVRFLRHPDVPGLEARYSSYDIETFRPHTHQAYSVGLIEHGESCFILKDVMHPILAGQAALINPGEVHACSPLSGILTYRMFYLAPSHIDQTGAEIYGPNSGPYLFHKPVADDPELFATFLACYKALENSADRLTIESLLFTGIARLLERHAGSHGQTLPDGEECAAWTARDFLARDYSRQVSLDDLAHAAGLSRYHLLRVFKKTFGMPPHAFQNQMRIEMAKRMLLDRTPIVETAHAAGFTDQSHFTRIFREYIGATPAQYLGK